MQSLPESYHVIKLSFFLFDKPEVRESCDSLICVQSKSKAAVKV